MNQDLALWGKTASGGSYHPVIYHMIDVANVARELCGSGLSGRFSSVLTQALGIEDPANLSGLIPLVAALHDIGKVSLPFQIQAESEQERLARAGFPLRPRPPADIRPRHQQLSALAVNELEVELQPLVAAGMKQQLQDAYVGHHGWYGAANELRPGRLYLRDHEPIAWREARRRVTRLLCELFPLPNPIDAHISRLRAATVTLTGFIILSDWLGSDTTYFRPSPTVELTDYLSLSRQRSRDAVAGTRLVESPSSGQVSWSGFRAAFPEIAEPRGIQLLVDELPLDGHPDLYIVEAATGSGKSEFALGLALRVAVQRGWFGLYFALPTTATSNQMYGRVHRFLTANASPTAAVELIHSQALLAKDALLGHEFRANPEADDGSPSAAAPNWFAPKKRALLAPHGVGTIDQAELAVLSARHYMLRLFGLVGKVVIIDEVHAYDVYMNTIIDHLLEWLASLDTTVILLSATLPRRRHQEMANAFLAGLKSPALPATEEPSPPDPLPYPLVSVYGPGGAYYLVAPDQPSRRRLTVKLAEDAEPKEEAARILHLVEGGGAVARITNTVNRAQELFQALRDLAGPDAELHLLHSRLPNDQRLEREARIVERLGPSSTRSIADKVIIVGTQVLEQSLDYDVDLMISDFAPVDLLLQRAGRLQRHKRPRRAPGFERPTLEVVAAWDARGIPDFGVSAFVYEPYILWKSWLALFGATGNVSDREIEIELPDDYRHLIEAAYDNEWDTPAVGEAIGQELQAARNQYEKRRRSARNRAQQYLIPDVRRTSPITEGRQLAFQEDDEGGSQGWGSASTRDGEESIQIVPLHRVAGGIAADPDGERLSRRDCDRATQLRLLRRAIRVSRPELVHQLPAIVEQDSGSAWLRRLPLLRNHVPLVLDDGRAMVGNLGVWLDPELGLVYQTKEVQ